MRPKPRTVGHEPLIAEVSQELARAGTRGVVLHGEAGIGKTTLLRALTYRLRMAGHEPAMIRTTASTSVPYAAVLDLIPANPAGALVEVLSATLDHLAAREQRVIAVIDDLPDLDAASRTLIDAALDRDLITVLATCRDGLPTSSETLAWVRRRGGRTIRVPAMTLADTSALAGELLGGRVGSATVARLHTATGGNPLHLEEVVHLGLSTGSLHPDPDGTFRARVDLPLSQGLVTMVVERLRALPPRMRRAVELLALGQPLPATVLRRVAVDRQIVDALRRTRTVEGADDELRLHHPLHAEAVLADLPDARRRRHLRRLLDAVAMDPQRDRGTQLRLAAWQLELGGPLPPSSRLLAARTAVSIGDLDLAEELLAADDSLDGRLVRAEAASARSEPMRALRYLDEAAASARTETDRARVALVRSQIGLIGLGDPLGAAASLATIDRTRIDGETASEIRAAQALLYLLTGRTDEAAAVAEDLTERMPTSTQVATLVSTSIAEMLRCDLATAERQARQGLALIEREPALGVLPFAEVQLHCSIVYSHLYGDRLEAALDRCRREHEGRVARGGAVAALWTSMRGHAELLAGNLQTAHDVASDAVAMTRAADPLGHGGLTMADQAIAAALLGDGLTAAELLDQLRHRPDARTPRVAINIARVQAWTHALAGDRTAAVDAAISGARHALESGYRSWAIFTAHDAVRLGGAARATDLLASLPRVPETWTLLGQLVRHADAAARDDPDDLRRVAEHLTGLGARLLAAEAYVHASRAAERHGQPRHATHLRRHADHNGLGDAWTLRDADPPRELTPREHEIAELAANGRSNREIADHLVLSVRTVENHLAAVYAKLGIEGRRGLTERLGLHTTQS